MKRALIGHTGFVGSHLKRDGAFTNLYNSSNFQEMAGQRYDEVVCAGISAVKWLANKEPKKDRQGIEALLDVLMSVETRRFTLISTIDIYPDPSLQLDETYMPRPEEGQPYGRHRLAVERFVAERFDDVLVARLPALFGAGLKKNMLFDLLTGNQTEKINPAAVFQWYPLSRLSKDLMLAHCAGLRLVNLFSEPLESTRIIQELFPNARVGAPAEPAPRYALRTAHDAVFGGTGGFIASADSMLAQISRFVEAASNDRGATLAR